MIVCLNLVSILVFLSFQHNQRSDKQTKRQSYGFSDRTVCAADKQPSASIAIEVRKNVNTRSPQYRVGISLRAGNRVNP